MGQQNQHDRHNQSGNTQNQVGHRAPSSDDNGGRGMGKNAPGGERAEKGRASDANDSKRGKEQDQKQGQGRAQQDNGGMRNR